MTKTIKIATGIIIGSLIGLTLGLFLTSEKGAKTRALLADRARKMVNTIMPRF